MFLTVDRKLKIRVLTDSAPWEEYASCLCVWPRSHCVHTRWRERCSDLCCLFLCCKAPALLRLYMTSFNLYYILKSLSPNAVTVGIRDSTYQLGVGETQFSHSNCRMEYCILCSSTKWQFWEPCEIFGVLSHWYCLT